MPSILRRRDPAGRRSGDERGQGLVEFSLVLPIFMLLLLVMMEFGYAFNHKLTVGYASREGARTGASLASGGATGCPDNAHLAWKIVDQQIIGAAQRILKSPGSDVRMADVTSIRIYKASSTGAQVGSNVNVWNYSKGNGPDLDPGTGKDILDFVQGSVGWPACSRNNGTNPDSIGVQIVYTYHLETPLGALVGFMGGRQGATMSMNDQTVMSLNPTN